MNKITLNKINYVLVPEEEYEEMTKLLRDMLSEKMGIAPKMVAPSPVIYPSATSPAAVTNTSDVPMAQPQVYEYRERFKRRELRPEDVTARTRYDRLDQVGDIDTQGKDPITGSDLYFGNGVEYAA